MDANRERAEEALDPHRRETLAGVSAELAGRLRGRGVQLTGAESSEDIVQLLESVEQFERDVVAAGGDLMVDSGAAPEPDNPAFVLPKRAGGESVADYRARIDAAARSIQRVD